eukprot:m.108972 g.108972  ORF g.108972 m.108972 type:complete len:111 (-) comp16952_c0_seq2:854-1186(-)
MNPIDAQIIQDVGVMYSTVLNHRQPLKREAKYLVREMDGKKGIECKRILETTATSVRNLHLKQLPECTMMAAHFDDLIDQIGVRGVVFICYRHKIDTERCTTLFCLCVVK